MARLFDDASSQYLQIESAAATAAPLTISAWANHDAAQTGAVVFVGDGGTSNNHFALRLANDSPSHAEAYIRSAAGTAAAGSAASFVLNEWHHGAAVYHSSASRYAYADGVAGAENTTDITPIGCDRMCVGRMGDSSADTYFSGMVAHAAVWTAALTTAEVASLAKGADPRTIRPESLVAYWPLVRDEDQDIVGGYNLADYNTPTIVAHPGKMRGPARVHVGLGISGAPTVPIAVIQDHYARMRRA